MNIKLWEKRGGARVEIHGEDDSLERILVKMGYEPKKDEQAAPAPEPAPEPAPAAEAAAPAPEPAPAPVESKSVQRRKAVQKAAKPSPKKKKR